MAESRQGYIFLIAGESSGDQLGAELMQALKQKTGGRLRFAGIGGPLMQAQGLKPLFPASDIAVMGPTAIIKNLSKILKRLRQTVEAVVTAQPDILLIIDSPEFTQRVARRVRKRLPQVKIIKYVAPQVWAWRQERAAKMRRYIDEILALLPFESEFYRRLGGPPTIYVGHPLIARQDLQADETARASMTPIIAVLPGSRISEVSRLLKPFGETLALLQQRGVQFQACIPVVPHLRDLIAGETADWPVKVSLVEGEEAKWSLFCRARAALVASGTATLELALAKVPMLVAYKVEALFALLLRRLIKIDTAALPNLILQEKIIPEFIQQDVQPALMAPQLLELLKDGSARQSQMQAFERLRQKLMLPGNKKPSEEAAERVLANLSDKAK